MSYTLTKGPNSNYEVAIELTTNEFAEEKAKVLKTMQKDFELKGFRKGHVPINLIERNLKPEYLEVYLYEEITYSIIKIILKEHPETKFIGNLYNLHKEQKDDKYFVNFWLDYYPEVEELNKNREAIKIDPINTDVSEEELKQFFYNIQRQYAQYKDIEKITGDSISKIKLYYLDNDNTELETQSIYIGEPEYKEAPSLRDLLIDKTKEDKLEIAYDESKIPAFMHAKKENGIPTKLQIEIIYIQEVILPELNDEFFQKNFSNSEYNNYEKLKTLLTQEAQKNKEETGLHQAIDNLISQASASLQITIPQTILDEEYNQRIQEIYKKAGGENVFKNHLNKIDINERVKYFDSIKQQAKDSLVKYFIVKKLTELYSINNEINREKHMDVEKKLYAKIVKQ